MLREQNALHTLIHQRHLTPSCRGHAPTAERTLDPARMLRESLNPGPELENSQGQTRSFGDVGSTSGLLPKAAVCRTSVDVAKVPCVDGSELARLFFTFAGWSVQPCVRPVCAVHMTAGHNALRGSGPGQKPAFDNALAQVGCPDRRIGRLCITCCSPSQPSHHADGRRDLVYTASATGSL
jgi:hypothetical protein